MSASSEMPFSSSRVDRSPLRRANGKRGRILDRQQSGGGDRAGQADVDAKDARCGIKVFIDKLQGHASSSSAGSPAQQAASHAS